MKPNFFKTQSLNTKITVFTLLIFVSSIWALTFYAGRTLRQDLQTLLGKQQLATVTFVANEVDQELTDRLQFLAQMAQVASPAVLQGGADVQRALDQYPAITSFFNAGVAVLDLQGTVIAEAPYVAGRLGANYSDRQHVITALKQGQTNVGKPIAGRDIKAPLLPLATPIFDTHGRVIGALSGLIDLSQPNFLDEIFAHVLINLLAFC